MTDNLLICNCINLDLLEEWEIIPEQSRKRGHRVLFDLNITHDRSFRLQKKRKMIRFVHRYAKFNKRLNALHKEGGKASIAAKNAEAIVEKFVSEGHYNPKGIGRLTKHGEQRIKNCLKYGLGNSYRLVCIKEGYHLIFLYIGTHDECDRWLNANRGLKRVIMENNKSSIIEEFLPGDPVHQKEPEPEIDEYEELLMEKIDEKVLRRIFRGLWVDYRLNSE